MVTAVVFILTFPFCPRSLQKVDSVGLFFCVVLSPGRYKGWVFFFFARKGACAVDPDEMCACFQTPSPLGRSHRHTPDPSASNVNNPAFPERRGGASGKERRQAVKYREIQKRNSRQYTLPRSVFMWEDSQPCLLGTWPWKHLTKIS